MSVIWPKPRRIVCGVIIDFEAYSIYHRGHEWAPRYRKGERIKKFQLVCWLLTRKLTIYELFNMLYDDETEGGPEYGPKIVYVFLHQLRIVLRKLELKLHRETLGPNDGHYRKLWIAP